MNKVLSQNEVDALLNAVEEEETDESVEESSSEGSNGKSQQGQNSKRAPISISQVVYKEGQVKKYDLTNQDRIMRGKMPMLDVIHDKFCRDFRSVLTMDIRKVVDVEPTTIELIKFREFLINLPMPACLSLFTMEPLAGSGLMTFNSEFIFLMVDLFCGGPGNTKFKVEGRDFTSIEQGIVSKVVERALAEMQNAWSNIFEVHAKFDRTEINAQFVSMAHPTEIVVRFNANIEVEGLKGWVSIVLPYAMIEPLKDKLTKGVIGERREMEKMWKKSIREKITESDVQIRGVLGKMYMDIGSLIKLQKDDVLELGASIDDPLAVEIEGIEKFYGRIGNYQGNKAIQVLGEIEQEI